MKRISFTAHELDLVLRMFCIAEAQVPNWGDGDYTDWRENIDGPALDSLGRKAAELYQRAQRQRETNA